MEALFSEQLWINILLLAFGSILLYFGAEGLVSGAAGLALRLGITPLVVGLTVVAFGTSSPELLVSLTAGMEGNSEIALGNVIGSNICNIALILGAAAVIRPIKVEMKVIKTDISLMIGISILFILLLLDRDLDFLDGVIFLVGIVAYNLFTLWMSKRVVNKKAQAEYEEEIDEGNRPVWKNITFLVLGLALLVWGSDVFLDGAIGLAEYFNVPAAIIALSVVAFGTSLPELATSIVASVKNKGDISVGNAIGSNIFNILLILGATSVLAPIFVSNISWIDLSVMLGVSILILPLSMSNLRLARWEGVLLLGIYGGYVYYLSTQII